MSNTDCEGCPLVGRPMVPGNGSDSAPFMVIGEAPGADEVVAGAPFVGKSGVFLRQMLDAAGIKAMYITNAVKCRPPDNATPDVASIRICRKFLLNEVDRVRPKGIILVGKTAFMAVTRKRPVTGHWFGSHFTWRGAKVTVIYHPSYLLRRLATKGSPLYTAVISELIMFRMGVCREVQ